MTDDNPEAAELYLVWTAATDSSDGWPGEVFALAPGLHLVRSALTQSRLYHRIKRRLPAGAGFLVAALETGPKHKGLAAGALAFVRSGAGKSGAGQPGIGEEADGTEASAARLGLV
jgi:hypothetical protein